MKNRTKSAKTSPSSLDRELSDRVGWFIKLRWIAGPGVCVGTLIGVEIFHFKLPQGRLFLTGLLILTYNALFWFYHHHRLKRRVPGQPALETSDPQVNRFVHLQIGLDWIALASVVHFSGGIQSPVLLFFVFHVVISSLLLFPLGCYLQVTFVIALVGSLAYLEYVGALPHFSLYANQEHLYTNAGYLVTYMFFFAAALYIAVFLTTSIASALRSQEQRLRETQKHLMRVEKLAAVGQLAAGVAHEINNPLGGILAYTHLVLEDLPEDAPQRENLSKVIRHTERCRDIVRDLLEFSRQRPPALTSVDVNAILEQALTLVQTQSSFRNVRVEKHLAELPSILADPHQLEQAFVNVMLNAGQAMQEGGQLTLVTEYHQPDNAVWITFQDTGPGIPEEYLDRVFDPFFTTKGVGQGTGLGLAVTYGIVEQHGGTIDVESMLGRGATFVIKLPVRGNENA